MPQHFKATLTDTSNVLTAFVKGVAQVETATAAGTASGDGNVTVTVTAAKLLQPSPYAISVGILSGDTAATWAGKVRDALAADATIAARFSVGGSGTAIVLTVLPDFIDANDAAMNIALANGSPSPGITAAATSTNTTAGVTGMLISQLAYGDRIRVTGLSAAAYVVSTDEAALTVTVSEAATATSAAATIAVDNTSTGSQGAGTVAAALTTRSNNLQARNTLGIGTAVFAVTLHNVRLQATAAATGTVSATLTHGLKLAAKNTQGTGTAGVLYLARERPILPLALTGTGAIERAVLDVASAACLLIQDVVESILALFGMCCSTPGVDDCMLAEILKDINAAHQLIYSKAHLLDYFNRDSIPLTIGTSGEILLDATIQNLSGDVRFAAAGGRRLALCTTQAELDDFVDAVYGGVIPSGPRAYFVDSQRQEDSPDSVALTLKVTPAPAGNTDFIADVSYQPRRYTVRDIADGTRVQMPHTYAELILLPILRKWASRDRRFTRREQQPEIDQQYQAAMTALGEVEPASTAEIKARPKQAAAA